MTRRLSIVRPRFLALIACSLFAGTVPFSAQAASDGTMRYPVDDGFVPIAVSTSVATLDRDVALYQEPTPEVVAEEGSASTTPDAAGTDFTTADEGIVPELTEAWVEPPPMDAVTGPAIDEAPDQIASPVTAPTGAGVDPATGETATSPSEVDPATGEWLDPSLADSTTVKDTKAPATEPGIAPTPVETPVGPVSSEVVVDPATEPGVDPAPVTDTPVDSAPAAGVSGGPAPGPGLTPVAANLPGETEPWGQPIATAYIMGTGSEVVPCYAAPDPEARTLAVLGDGQQVEVRGESVGEWQPVNCAGVGGYINTAFITHEPRVPAADDGQHRADAEAVTAVGTGSQVTDFALQYLGYPYADGGEGPDAFDCSGFTKFVILNTLGIDITHDMFQQIEMGTPVGRDELQPGDLVFFSDTFRPGLSHVGIYLGDGQFVHAENESTGVRVSALTSDYYGSRWTSGRRLA